ncbi:MAG: ATP-dependent DNA helicase [Bradymonadaceae bacterium]
MTTETLDDIFAPGGLLAEAHPNYEHRPQQIEMARAVERAFDERHPLVVEAATGTGKTLAYLVPALRSGRRVVVSTGTKALQEQLFRRDLPFLERHWPEDVDAALLKGRRNYLCKLRFEEFRSVPSSLSPEEQSEWGTIREWARETDTGDRAEIGALPDDSSLWPQLSVGPDNCLHRDCRHYEDCFVTQARADAEEADVLVVNHHLFFADLSLRGEGYGSILPPYDAVVFDEAHHLERVATSFFGIGMSRYRVRDLTGDVYRYLQSEGRAAPAIYSRIEGLDSAADELFDQLDGRSGEGRHALSEVYPDTNRGSVAEARDELAGKLEALEGDLADLDDPGEVGRRLRERCGELVDDLRLITDRRDSDYAYVADVRDTGTFLRAEPIDLGDTFRERLFETHDTLVFTSASLATGGTLDFFERRLGVQPPGGDAPSVDVDELVLPPVFDHREQSVLYLPEDLPSPNAPTFCDAITDEIADLLAVTRGRAFVLFTSYANLNEVHDRLAEDLPHPTLLQGERPRSRLLETFRSQPDSVLFATRSFWEGVDVEGASLSQVVIDKLPFANPSDPLISARQQRLRERGENPFRALSLPSAALSLKQGAGRLIRSRSDRGIVAILDSRMANKRYGRYFLETLPDMPVRSTVDEIRNWWTTAGATDAGQ